jgi:hypothetical protein
MLELLLSLAIVTQDQIPLRAAPNENAARHATLSHGENLEIRGQKGDYLQVYDHRRERAGYIRATQAGQYALTPEEAPRLRAVVDFLKDQSGAEAVGIGHAAAFFKAAPAEAIDAGAFEALGRMADRLAGRASLLTGSGNGQARVVSDHLDVAATYGVTFYSVERFEKVTLCYEGDAWRRVLALPASPEQKAQAALSLTRHDCVKHTLSPGERLDADLWRAEVLDRVLAEGNSKGGLPGHIKNRLKIRAAGVWASLAHELSRRSDKTPAEVFQAGQNAENYLAGVDKSMLVDGDRRAWHEAAIRVGASRWAAQPQSVPVPDKNRPGIKLSAGEPGQTCVQVVNAGNVPKGAPFSRCTYGTVWPASLSVSPDGKAMALAVQPLDNWRELWVFRAVDGVWQVDVVPPSVENPELGYVEFAGWVPGNNQLLAARETVANNLSKTSFELWNRSTLKVEKSADKPGNLTAFHRWQAPAWKSGTVALR